LFHTGDFFTEVAASLIVALLSALVLFLYKLPKTLEKIEQHMKKADEKFEEHDKRLDVHDVLWSTFHKKSVNSRMISQQQMHYPWERE
jgi:hypothetical protein